MAKRAQFGGQVIEMPDDATEAEMAQAIFESRATPSGLGVAPGIPSGMPDMVEGTGGAHPLEKYNAMLEAAQPFYGAAKGLGNTAIGIGEWATKIPGFRKLYPMTPGEVSLTANEKASVEPIGVGQKIGYIGEQVGEFSGPGELGKGIGGLVKVAERVKQGRTAAGLFTKATRSPVQADIIKRMLLRGGSEAAATGLLNEAQGGDFNTGAGASVLGQGTGAAARKIGPLVNKLLKHRVQSVGGALLTAGGIGIGGEEYYRRAHGPSSLIKPAAVAGLAAGLAFPRTRGPIIGSFLQAFDRHEAGTVARGRGGRIGTAR